MPELAVKIKIAPSSSSTTISGMSHHFFSCRVNLKNSLRSAHIDFFQGRISNHCWQWQICAAQLRFLEQLPAALRILRCLLYTSDAADDLLCVDLGGRR